MRKRSRLFVRVMPALILVFGIAAQTFGQCTDADGDAFFYESGCGTLQDCNDAAVGTYPGALELCDGYDDDCDGLVDNDAACDTTCDLPGILAGDIRATDELAQADAASLIWTGSEYGMVWTENRHGTTEIYFARVDASGNKLGQDIRITNDPAQSREASLVWTGSEYGAAWVDYRDGAGGEIYFTRIDALGNKLGSDLRITSGGYAYDPSLVWNGQSFALAWEDDRDDTPQLYFVHLDALGNKLGSEVQLTGTAPEESWYANLVWNGSGYGLAWMGWENTDTFDVFFARLDETGTLIGGTVRVSNPTPEEDSPSLVWTGSEYGIAWENDTDGEVYFTRLDASGNEIGDDIAITNSTTGFDYPSVMWTGSEYGMTWNSNAIGERSIYFARLDAAGVKLGAEQFLNSVSPPIGSVSVAAAWNGSGYGFTWQQDGGPGLLGIHFARLSCDCSDADGDGTSVCTDCDDANPECTTDCTDSDSDGYCVTHDCNDNTANCTTDCTDVDSDGFCGATDCDDSNAACTTDCTDADSDGFCITSDCDETNPNCTYNCMDLDSDGLRACDGDCNDAVASTFPGATETCDGYDNDCNSAIDDDPTCDMTCGSPSLIGAGTSVAPSGAADHSVVWTGAEYGVAWRDSRDGNNEIYFARLDASGAKIGGDVRVTNDPSSSENPFLVWTGSEFGVAWDDLRATNQEIYFARLDASGTKIGGDIRVTNAASGSFSPSLVWTGSEYGMSWTDSRVGGRQVYFVHLDAAGGRIGADAQITSNPNYGAWRSTLVWSGSEYGLAYSQGLNMYFVRLDPDGSTIGVPLDIGQDYIPSYGYDWAPAMVWTGSGYGLIRSTQADLRFTGLDASGAIVAQQTVATTTLEIQFPQLAWTGSEYGLVWEEMLTISPFAVELFFVRLDPSGSNIGSDVRLTDAPPIETFSAIAWTGSEYGLFWQTGGIHFAQLTCECIVDADVDGICEPDDCDDTNPNCTTDCTDADADGLAACAGDCNDTNANCTTDCTDADVDGFCITSDCNDAIPGCTTDCTDADLDGLAACAGDCNDANANCISDCTDADTDGFCVTSDCDDTNANCTTDCTDADTDGFCVTSDCDDINANCISDCTDADSDGFCITTDCDEADPDCNVDCTDADQDGLRVCNGDCDGDNPNCTTDCTDADADGFCVTTDCDDADSLVPTTTTGWWPADSSAIDVSGGNHGTLIGGTSFEPGVAGQAFLFDGVDDQVDFGDVLNNLVVPFSLEAWIKTPGSAGTSPIFFSDNAPTSSGVPYSGIWFYLQPTNKLLINYGDGGTVHSSNRRSKQSDAVISVNTWTHVAAVVRGPADMSLYIDGVDAGGTHSGTGGNLKHTGYPATLGVGIDPANHVNGSIDEFAVYDRALSAVEVGAIYDAGSAGKKGCVVCSDLDLDGFCDYVDCNDAVPNCTTVCTDTDVDGFAACAECDDTRGDVYPGAPALCDGINNDCSDPGWPALPADEMDIDADGYSICAGDCNDADALIHPLRLELCNDLDDDCDGLTDEDALGEDSDGDSLANLCDNCPVDSNLNQDDFDADGVGDVCDNCAIDWNVAQTDFDGDSEGDRCDTDDGMIYMFFDVVDRIDWQIETGFDAWNCYVGDLDELESSGTYTQVTGTNPLADRVCAMSDPYMDILTTPGPGKVAFHLVTGTFGSTESSLGNDSSPAERPNDWACMPLP